MKKKINKILILALVIILMVNLIFLYNGLIDNGINGTASVSSELSKSSIKLLAELENEIARDKLNAKNQNLSYMDMYPDMYVESIKPIIYIEEEKIAYLTFDDGPSEITEQILDILDKYNIKATFFVIGCTITVDGEEYLKEMVKRGHTLGIHTFSHNYKNIYSSVDAYLEDFYKVYQLVYEVTGVRVNIFRFPWGSYNGYSKNIKDELVAEMERRGFTYYDWNVSADDSVGKPSANQIKRNIFKDLERYNNPIILMHDASVNKLTAKTLPEIIEAIIDRGYEFDTVDHREPFHFDY